MINTNQILKQMVKKAYYDRNSNYSKNKLVYEILKVDIQNYHPNIFTDKYVKQVHERDLFIFLDKNLEVLGILKGKKWEQDYETYEDYYKQYSDYESYNHVKKNWSAMEERAEYILTIPNEDRKLRQKQKKREIDYKQKLQNRLNDYKREKQSNNDNLEYVKNLVTNLQDRINNLVIDGIKRDKATYLMNLYRDIAHAYSHYVSYYYSASRYYDNYGVTERRNAIVELNKVSSQITQVEEELKGKSA